MNDTFIKIDLNKIWFRNNEPITGFVILKTRVPLLIEKINLNFSKIRHMDVYQLESPSGPSNRTPLETGIIYEYDYLIYDSTKYVEELSCGSHKFLFKFRLKSTDSSSTDVKGVYFDYLVNIRNSYVITASVFLTGAEAPVYKTKKTIQIIEINDDSVNFQSQIELSSVMCLFYKTYSLKFNLNKFIYFSGDQVFLSVSSSYYITKKIKKVDCNLYEVVTIQTQTENIIRTRYIVGSVSEKNKNEFLLSFRIPSITPSCVNEDKFSLRVLMFITVYLKNASPVRVKKYINIAKKQIELPLEDEFDVLEGETFDEKLFVFV